MIGATFCSGIGAPEIAAPWVDWRLASEIESFLRAVLAERFGYAPPEEQKQGEPLLCGDMAEITSDLWRRHGIPLPQIVVAGTPCQSFSVAGARKGLKDDRGNLTLKFVELCHTIVNARPDGKLIILWENVPGILSDRGNAFGALLGGIVGAMDALSPPRDGSWPGEGMVSGPRARAAWSVLDAQWFGVAQRRRRVFVVIDFGRAVDPAKILLEPESLRGHFAPRREAREGIARDFETGLGCGVFKDGLNAGTMVAHTLRGEGFDATEDGTGRGTPVIPVAFDCKAGGNTGLAIGEVTTPLRGDGHGGGHAAIAIQERATSENPNCGPGGVGFRDDDAAYTLEARTVPQAVAFAENSRAEVRLQGGDGQVAPQLTTGGGKPGQGQPCVAFDLRGREGGAMPEGPHETANIRAASGGSSRSYVASPYAVRRLTPTECHRLQGFPDDHCTITYRGKPAADGPQYKALGNSMAVPVIRWIMERIRISAFPTETPHP